MLSRKIKILHTYVCKNNTKIIVYTKYRFIRYLSDFYEKNLNNALFEVQNEPSVLNKSPCISLQAHDNTFTNDLYPPTTSHRCSITLLPLLPITVENPLCVFEKIITRSFMILHIIMEFIITQIFYFIFERHLFEYELYIINARHPYCM